MSSVGMQGMIEQMRALSASAGNQLQSKEASSASSGFGEALKASIDRINEAQTSAKGESEAFIRGEPGVSLVDVMVNNQQASLTMQMGIQVRNQMVGAYREIMNMQV